MDITIIIVSIVIAVLFLSFSFMEVKEMNEISRTFLKEDYREKTYINTVQRISAFLAGCYSLIFAYFYYFYNLWSILMILSLAIYYLSMKVLLIVYDYIEINKEKL